MILKRLDDPSDVSVSLRDAMGVETFLAEAQSAGVDGLIVVDLPPEEDDE